MFKKLLKNQHNHGSKKEPDRKITSSSSQFSWARAKASSSTSTPTTCLHRRAISVTCWKFMLTFPDKLHNTGGREENKMTYPASNKAAAIPSVPHPQPRSATTFPVISPKLFSAYTSTGNCNMPPNRAT